MMDLLKHRMKIKGKKPKFRRTDSHKKKRVPDRWRKPRGLQNKMRLNKRGYPRSVTTGWRSPKEVRGLHPSGLEEVRVHNVSELAEVDSKTQGAIIGATVGDRKREQIIKKAEEKDIKILNIDADEYLKKIEEKLKQRKKEQEQREERKEEKDKEAEKAAKEAEKEEEEKEELSEEDKQKQDKEEKDKVLTKK